jgi:4-hydroxy 2-oxovalerate aldolase
MNVAAGAVLPCPEGDPEQLVLTTINGMTAYILLQDFAQAQPGEWVLQNGGNSSCGRFLIALARRHSPQPPGLHAHHTRGCPVEHSPAAHAHGCDLVDVSLNGFGLAGGNTSFAGLLRAVGLADAAIDARTRAFCAGKLSLRHAPSDDRALFRALAERNIDPIWNDALRDAFPDGLIPLLRTLPRDTYKTLDQALQALTRASGADAYRRCA